MQNIQRKHILTHTSGKWIITSKQSHKPVISVLFGDITESSRQHYSIHLTGKLCSSRQIKVCKILYSQQQTNISVNLKKNPHTHTLSLSPLSLSFSTFDPFTVTVHVVLYFFRLSNHLSKPNLQHNLAIHLQSYLPFWLSIKNNSYISYFG